MLAVSSNTFITLFDRSGDESLADQYVYGVMDAKLVKKSDSTAFHS